MAKPKRSAAKTPRVGPAPPAAAPAPVSDPIAQAPQKPQLPPLDVEAAMRSDLHATKAGNEKLQRAVEILRAALELVESAEYDHQEKREVSAGELRHMAREGLRAYSQHCGQNWRRNPLVGDRRGDYDMDSVDGYEKRNEVEDL